MAAANRFRMRACAAAGAAAAAAFLPAPPVHGVEARGIARAAAGADPVIATACRRALATGRAAVFCDRGRAPKGAVTPRGRAAMLPPGQPVTVRVRHASRRAQLVLIYRVARKPVYVRFSGFGRGRAVRARVTSRVRAGKLDVRLRGDGGRSWIPAESVPLAAGATAADPDPPAPGSAVATPVAPVATGATDRTCGALPDTGDAAFNRLFASCGPGNTGADGAYSVPLPDGRVAWLFSDTFVGSLNPDGSRARARFVRNSIAIQRDGRLTTVHGGTQSAPESLFPQPGGGDWYWTGDGTIDGGKLRVFLQRFRTNGSGDMWDFHLVGAAVATLSLPDLRLEAIDPLAGGSRVAWGAAVLERADHTYVYGVEDLGDEKFAHIARAPRGALDGAWEYWDGTGWSGAEAASARIAGGVSNAFSVLAAGDEVRLVTQETAFGRDVTERRGATPAGPFGDPATVTTLPDPGAGRAFSYGALVHPEFNDEGGTLLSWSVNAFDSAEAWRDASLYRPRFARVALASGD